MTAAFAALTMLVRDSVATLLTITEAKKRALYAAILAAMMDCLGVLVTVFGAIQIDKKGVSVGSGLILSAMMVSSATATYLTVRFSDRLLALSDPARRVRAGGN